MKDKSNKYFYSLGIKSVKAVVYLVNGIFLSVNG